MSPYIVTPEPTVTVTSVGAKVMSPTNMAFDLGGGDDVIGGPSADLMGDDYIEGGDGNDTITATISKGSTGQKIGTMSNVEVATLSFDQIQLIKSSIQYKKPLDAPIIQGNSYGKLLIEIEGKPNIEVDLVAKDDVGSINPIFKVFAALKYLIFGSTLDE